MADGEALRGMLSGVARAFQGLELARKDFRRVLLAAARAGASEQDLRGVIRGGRLPDLVSELQEAEVLLPVAEGFSGAGPYEICQRYAAGQISREQLVDELVRWDYPPVIFPTDILDDVLIDPPGSWTEVTAATRHGLIDSDLYGEVQDWRHRGGPQGEASEGEGAVMASESRRYVGLVTGVSKSAGLRGMLSGVARAFQGLELARKDFRRVLLAAARAGASEQDLRGVIRGGRLPDLVSELQEAEVLLPVAEGFSGAGPYEICQRYAAGQISREQLVDELVRWNYPPMARTTDILDDLLVDPPGAWSEVELAELIGLIDLDLYGEVLDLIEPDDPEPSGKASAGQERGE